MDQSIDLAGPRLAGCSGDERPRRYDPVLTSMRDPRPASITPTHEQAGQLIMGQPVVQSKGQAVTVRSDLWLIDTRQGAESLQAKLDPPPHPPCRLRPSHFPVQSETQTGEARGRGAEERGPLRPRRDAHHLLPHHQR